MKNQVLTQKQKDKIIDLYVNQKRGQEYVRKQVGISVAQLKIFLKENNIHIRTYGEAASASNKNRTKKKNIDYFKTQSANMAWILGFLAADGSIAKGKNEIRIAVSSQDREILEKIKSEIEIENDVTDYVTADGYPVSKISWTCEEHKKDLSLYSIVPQKTFVLKPPYNLDKKYWIDYIRGYFDGDGSINFIQSNKSLRWQICSATPEILSFILKFFKEEYNIPEVSIQTWKRVNHPLYGIQYSTNATKQIYKILYNDSNFYLNRKKKHFEEILLLMK